MTSSMTGDETRDDSLPAIETPNSVTNAGDAEEYHDFALLISVSPENRIEEWGRLLERAAPDNNMSVSIRKPTLVLFAVKAEVEFQAIERAEDWLKGIANEMRPEVTLAFNAQPTDEMSFAPLPHERDDEPDTEEEPVVVGIPRMEIGETTA
jgi:hypothetical protein